MTSRASRASTPSPGWSDATGRRCTDKWPAPGTVRYVLPSQLANERIRLRSDLVALLGTRRLIWFGTRAEDAASLDREGMLHGVVSLIGRVDSARATSLSLEELTGRRVDLDLFDVDVDLSSSERAWILDALRAPRASGAIAAYRPSRVVESLRSSHADPLVLVMSQEAQRAFEDKARIEAALCARGIPVVGWGPADASATAARRLFDEGPVLVRDAAGTSGGVGVRRVRDTADLESVLAAPRGMSISPYIDGAVPVNVAGVVWGRGLTLHPATVQLIGIADCTAREFGYCGNDAAALARLDRRQVEALERLVVAVGDWLHESGYRGAFGVDALIRGPEAIFLEINPRLQGSTRLSGLLSHAIGAPDIVLEHLGAIAGLAPPPLQHLTDLASVVPEWAHVVVHARSPKDRGSHARALVAHAATNGLRDVDSVLPDNVIPDAGAILARLTTETLLTETGYSLVAPWERVLRRWASHG